MTSSSNTRDTSHQTMSRDEARSLTDQQWQERLSPEAFEILRKTGTEPPFTDEYWDIVTVGIYCFSACGADLFESNTMFGARCGLPSFFAPTGNHQVVYVEDSSLGMTRVEVRFANCASHLGHVFAGEGFVTPRDLRYCINSLSLNLTKSSD